MAKLTKKLENYINGLVDEILDTVEQDLAYYLGHERKDTEENLRTLLKEELGDKLWTFLINSFY